MKTIAESAATLARWPRGTDSSAKKEQLEELAGISAVLDSRFQAAARSSARSRMDGAGKSVGRAASIQALRQEAYTGVDADRACLV